MPWNRLAVIVSNLFTELSPIGKSLDRIGGNVLKRLMGPILITITAGFMIGGIATPRG